MLVRNSVVSVLLILYLNIGHRPLHITSWKIADGMGRQKSLSAFLVSIFFMYFFFFFQYSCPPLGSFDRIPIKVQRGQVLACIFRRFIDGYDTGVGLALVDCTYHKMAASSVMIDTAAGWRAAV